MQGAARECSRFLSDRGAESARIFDVAGAETGLADRQKLLVGFPPEVAV